MIRRSNAVSFYATPPGSLDVGLVEAERQTYHASDTTPRIRTASTPRTPVVLTPRTPTQAPRTPTQRSSSKPSSPVGPPRQAEDCAQPQQRVWKSGVYSLVNAGSGTVIDLSGSDGTSIIGFAAHHGPNQQVSVVFCHYSRIIMY